MNFTLAAVKEVDRKPPQTGRKFTVRVLNTLADTQDFKETSQATATECTTEEKRINDRDVRRRGGQCSARGAWSLRTSVTDRLRDVVRLVVVVRLQRSVQLSKRFHQLGYVLQVSRHRCP